MCINSKTVGMITAIQKFCINDGPGIRTTVFMKGCPLNCIWCHNPETKSFSPEMFYDTTKCIGCRACLKACPIGCHSFDQQHHYDRENCTYCGRCVKACATQALELSGKELSVEEIIEEVMKDKIFYDNSGGGMTLSGGEPLAQPSFTLSLLEQAKKKGLHTCIETCGFAPEAYIRQIVPYVDVFLYDYKETDPVRHKEFTGVTNEKILSNLRLLDSLGANIILRCPMIPTKNDREDHLHGIALLANSLHHVLGIDIEPYHPLGKGKGVMLGKDDLLDDIGFPSEETVQQWIDIIAAKTKIPVKKA